MSEIEEIFLNASQLAPDEREDFLKKNCPDADSFERVSSLLAAHDRAGDFMESPPVDVELTGAWPFAEETQNQIIDDTFSPLLEKLFPGAKFEGQSLIVSGDSSSESVPRKGRLDHYEIESILGQGGMGMVLKGFDTKLKRHVAIKVLPKSFHAQDRQRQRFVREAQTAAQLSHPNVVAVYAVEDSEFPYIVMELVPGKTLGQLVKEKAPLPLDDILSIGKQIAEGLAAAHRNNLIHRDIKPGNILVKNDGQVKIADFGLAKELFDADQIGSKRFESELSCAGELYGTPQYMSPEQTNGEALDSRSDLFSVGSVLYLMCTGNAPFADDSFVKVLKLVQDKNPDKVCKVRQDLPDALGDLIHRLMMKLPKDRIESAETVAALLDEIRINPKEGRNRIQLANKENPQATLRRPIRSALVASVFAILLLLVSEGTGFTNFGNMLLDVIRVKTAQGTFVITVDDPNITVTINGNVINVGDDGKTIFQYEIGEHAIKATKDGKVIVEKVVTLTRGGKEVVTIAKELNLEKAKAGGKKSGNALADGNKKPKASSQVSPILGDPITITGHTLSIHTLCYSPDGKKLATGQLGFQVRVWSIADAKPGSQPKLLLQVRSERQTPHRVLFSPDGKRICCGRFQWDLETGNKLNDLPASLLDWSSDGKLYATQPKDGVVDIHLADSGKVKKSIETNQGNINACRFSPNGKWLATGGENSTRIWDVESGSRKSVLKAGNGSIYFVEFSRDGRKMLTGGEDHKTWIWTLDEAGNANAKPVATLVGHRDNVYGARFYDGDKRVVSVSRESARTFPEPGKKRGQTLKFWDAESGIEIWDQIGHSHNVTDIDIRNDSLQIATCSLDQRVKLWNLKKQK